MLFDIIAIILVLALIGSLPSWGYWGRYRTDARPNGYGYMPTGLIGVVLVIFVLWLLLGHGRL